MAYQEKIMPTSLPRVRSTEELLKPLAGGSPLLHEFFEAQADRCPNNQAIIAEGRILTYGDVEQRANQWAHHLKSLGIGPGQLVGILLNRSEQPIISLLAVLKAGGGYVPIDPSYPAERIGYIFEISGIQTVITESSLEHLINDDYAGHRIDIDRLDDFIASQPGERIPNNRSGASSEDICYVIFTSGTTGHPKGVVTEHRSASCFIESFRQVCNLTDQDRVYQGFSLGFDGSVEEIWMAFSSGAALVVACNDSWKLGDEVARLINSEGITYFSTVPTLLSMINDELPTVKLLIVSGEVCPPELVEKWATPQRRMLNVYGPTEATVNATVEECVPGVPVTIGRPLENYEPYILGPDHLPVGDGESGELYIAGPALARGYLNQPELTAQQFITIGSGLDSPKRLYRTGDLVSRDADGKLLFLGRIDSQVKIRGFRIEVAEIEVVLGEHPAVEAAAVKVVDDDGMKHLAAFVALADPAADLDRDEVLNLLQGRLPSYMVPAYLDVIDVMPRLVSGKIDRKQLPEPETPLLKDSRTIVAPSTGLEKTIVSVFETVIKLSPVSVEDDFFQDLAGYSLLAAQTATRLREELALDVAIRDIYDHPTAAKLAAHLQQSQRTRPATPQSASTDSPDAREVCHSVSPWTRGLCHGLQALSLGIFYGIGALPFAAYLIVGFSWLQGELDVQPTILIATAVTLAAYPALLTFVILSKWLVIGRFRAGSYPLWSLYYFRWWFVSRAEALSGIGVFAGTPVINLYFRLMGARVGRGVILDSPLCSVFDLFSIGDDSSIGNETQFSGYRIENGMLKLGRVDIGDRCFVGIHSNLALNVRMEDDSALADMSLLPDNTTVARGQHMRGSPARPGNVRLPDTPEFGRHPIRFGLLHIAALLLLGLYMSAMALPTVALIAAGFIKGGLSLGIGALYLSAPLLVATFCLSVALIKYLLLGRVAPGVYPVESGFYLRKWLIDGLMRASIHLVKPLYTTIYLPPWLRLLGTRIGRRAEISTVSQISPELISISDESFFADGSIIGGRHFYRGYFEISASSIGTRSFVGNSAILPVGSNIGDHCLLGCLSAPPDLPRTPDHTEWLGSPSFQLPHRKKVEGFSDEVTYRPTVRLYAQRLCVDAMRVLIPGMIGISSLIGFTWLVYVCWQQLGVMPTLLLAPLFGLTMAVLSALAVALLKKAVMGTFEPVVKPLWSLYVWFNEMINGAFESVFAPAVAPLLGTPWIAPLLRAMGCKIGKHNFIETTLFSEFDLVEIGDHVALNRGVIVQNHLFEDRIMKSDYLKIGNCCSVGNMAVVLYSSVMAEGSSIGPLSLLMKGETLPAKSHWHGIPIEGIALPRDKSAYRPRVFQRPQPVMPRRRRRRQVHNQ